MEEPGEGDLRRGHAARTGDGEDAVDDVVVGLGVELSRVVVGLGARGDRRLAAPVAAREKTARERAPRQDADTLLAAERQHLALFLAVDEVVVVLHRDETREAAPVRRRE